MEARINDQINRLLRECELKCDFIQSGSHSHKFVESYSSDYWTLQRKETYINAVMMSCIRRIENEALGHYEFGYEVSNEGNEWKITIEWISKISNPFMFGRAFMGCDEGY